MFRNPEEVRRRLQKLVERFRQKGATSPEKAMSIQELGLPSHFEEAMHRRLGRSGIFVEVNGKYYLNEERLEQLQEQRARIGSDATREGGREGTGSPSWSRIGVLLILPMGLIIAIVLFYFAASGAGFFPGEILIILLIVFIVMTLIRLLFWMYRRRYWRERSGTLGNWLNLQVVFPNGASEKNISFSELD
jgi:hypothetical protein